MQGILTDEGNGQKTVDREFVLYFSTIDENESWYLDENIDEYCTKPEAVDKADMGFIVSNAMYAVNGYVFGNTPIPKMHQGEQIAWRLISLGSKFDLHTVHFHGQTFLKVSQCCLA